MLIVNLEVTEKENEMTNEELVVLAKTDSEYADILYRKNVNLTKKIAARYAKEFYIDFEDTIGFFNIAFMKTIERFEPSKGFKFSTLYLKIARDICSKLVRDKRAKKRTGFVVSLNAPVYMGEEDIKIEDVLHVYDDYSNISTSLYEEAFKKASEKMPETQKNALIVFLFKGISQKGAAKLCGVSQPYMGRIIKQFRNRFAKLIGVSA